MDTAKESEINYLWNIWNTKQLKLKGTNYTLKGFSVAALRSNFFIKELNIMFDAGLSAPYSPDHIFVTHTHTDHCANLPYHLYSFNKKETQRMQIYIPGGCEEKTDKLITSVHTLNTDDDFDGAYTIIPVIAENDLTLEIKGKKFIVEIIKCYHTVPCVGYGLIETKKKLKSEYIGKDGKIDREVIIKLKSEGIDINREERDHIFLYLGDTSQEILDDQSIYKYKTIMIECTFIDDEDEERATLTKHIHLKHLMKSVLAHPDITFILYHFSSKYRREEIEKLFTSLAVPNITVWNSN
jgi:ribonuclease Z